MIGRQGGAAYRPPGFYDCAGAAIHDLCRDQAVVSASPVVVNKFFQITLDTGTGAGL